MKKILNIGDILYRSKGIVQHVGILIRENQVLHNSPDGNVQISCLSEYSQGKKVKVVSKSLDLLEQKRLIDKAESLLLDAKQYGVITFNCEHLASMIQSGKPTSEQLQAAGLGAAAGLIFSRCNNSGNALAYTLVGGLLGCALANATRRYDHVL